MLAELPAVITQAESAPSFLQPPASLAKRNASRILIAFRENFVLKTPSHLRTQFRCNCTKNTPPQKKKKKTSIRFVSAKAERPYRRGTEEGGSAQTGGWS